MTAITVTSPALIAVLFAIVGVVIVGVGGGLIKPMQERWETYLHRIESEAPNVKAAADAAPSIGEQARANTQRVKATIRPSDSRDN